jgi:myo-inositol-1(or 4)-monophosphatase
MQAMTRIAIRAAHEAGKLILKYADKVDHLPIDVKGRNDFVSDIDRGAEQIIIESIRKAYPEHAILAEETGRHSGENDSDFLWVIDPLDGTTNYLHGFPQYSVSIALKHKGMIVSAVVYDPLSDETFSASKGNGALVNDRRMRVAKHKSLDGTLISTGFPYRAQSHLEEYINMFRDIVLATAGIRRPGSAALDFAYVAAGRTDGFWELGLSEWDFAPGALLVTESGGIVTDIAGGSRHLETGNVIAGNLKVHKALLDIIKPYLKEKLALG